MKLRFFQKPSYLTKSTFVLTTGTGLRTIFQAIVFLILVRILGAESYGSYAAVLAIASSLGGFCGLGTQILLVRDVAREPAMFNKAWGLVLAAMVVGTPILVGVYLFFSWLLLSKISWSVILLIGLSELILSPLSFASVYAYQGHERMGRASRLMLVPVLPRFIGAVFFVIFTVLLPAHTYLSAWCTIYAAAAFISAIYAVRLVNKDLGLPLQPDFLELMVYIRKGTSFAVGGVAQKLYIDIDKTMLAMLSDLGTTGAYSAGYRVVDMATIPLRSILTSVIPQFFRTGKEGAGYTIRYALRMLPWPLTYALVCGFFLYFSARILPFVFGPGYELTVQVLQYLVWLPLLSITRLFIQTALSTSGQQGSVIISLIVGAIVNILLNLWLIPQSGWQGAVTATYVAEFLMLGLMFSLACLKRSAKSEKLIRS